MLFRRCFFFLISLTALWLYSFTADVLAAENFAPSYNFLYEVSEDGNTKVTQNISLTNLTTNFYPVENTLTFATEKIDEISAYDALGPLAIDVKKENNQTKIHIVFNEKVLGKGKTFNWTLVYQSTEISRKSGRIWEINIPKTPPEEKNSSSTVSLKLPQNFGEPSSVWPKPKLNYLWTGDDAKNGISLSFGDWQGFNLDLTYHLSNSGFLPTKTLIALPMDTAYQKVILKEINPPAKEIVSDQDGNWLAEYLLLPQTSQTVKVKVSVQVFDKPLAEFKESNPSPTYLSEQKFWEKNEEIKRISSNLKTVRDVYNFVVETLNYSYERANQKSQRLGSAQIIKNPNQAICMEFTDLFISLARAIGIPAREVDGFAYTFDSRLKPLSLVSDILHAWPEYWNGQSWIQVDPTWEKTSGLNYFDRFDFNHLAFSKRGLSSTFPFPAGSYKEIKDLNSGKDVLVNFTETLPVSDFIPPPKKMILYPKSQELDLFILIPIIIILILLILLVFVWQKLRQRFDRGF